MIHRVSVLTSAYYDTSSTFTAWKWKTLSDVFGHTCGHITRRTFPPLQDCARYKMSERLWCSCRYFLHQRYHLFLIVPVIHHSNGSKFDFCFTFQRKQASVGNPDVGFPCCYASVEFWISGGEKWVKKHNISWKHFSRTCIVGPHEGHGKRSTNGTCVIAQSHSFADPHCHWSIPIPGGPDKPIGMCVAAFRAGVACGGKFKRECVSCHPSAEASINMIPIVLASVLVASGKNIWHPLILPVIVSVCLCEGVCACILPHRSKHCALLYRKEKWCSSKVIPSLSCLMNPHLVSITLMFVTSPRVRSPTHWAPDCPCGQRTRCQALQLALAGMLICTHLSMFLYLLANLMGPASAY